MAKNQKLKQNPHPANEAPVKNTEAHKKLKGVLNQSLHNKGDVNGQKSQDTDQKVSNIEGSSGSGQSTQGDTIVGNIHELVAQSDKPAEEIVLMESTIGDNTDSGSLPPATDTSEQPLGEKQKIPFKQTRPSFVSLFKNNRSAHSKYKLKYVKTGEEILDFDDQVIDTVEDTFGICLLGFIVGGRPPTAALVNLVKRWGPNVQFQTNSSGWITFIFPSVELRDKILNEGPHMVFGYHLFLKEMPRYFRYSEEDMNTLPSWVRIHGIPPSCWNEHILSRVASKIGIPVHMDMLTYDRKRMHYARVLIEIDNSKARVEKMNIRIPIGIIELKFEYECDMEQCQYYHKIGHRTVDCLLNPRTTAMESDKGNGNTDSNEDKEHRGRSRIVAWRRQGSRERSRAYQPNRNSRSRTRRPPATNQRRLEPPKQPVKNKYAELANEDDLEAETAGMENILVDDEVQIADPKGKAVVECQLPLTLTTDKVPIVNQPKDDKHKRNKSRNRKKKDDLEEEAEMSLLNTNILDDMDDNSSSNTELIRTDGSGKDERIFGSLKKGRHPQGASGGQ